MQRECDAIVEHKLMEIKELNNDLINKIHENNTQREKIRQLEDRIKLMGGENQI